MRVEESIEIGRPRKEVFDYVSEPSNFPEWTATAIEVDFLEDLLDSEWALSKQEELRREYEEALPELGGLLFSSKKVGLGQAITATATGSEGTSEFSAPKTVVASK